MMTMNWATLTKINTVQGQRPESLAALLAMGLGCSSSSTVSSIRPFQDICLIPDTMFVICCSVW